MKPWPLPTDVLVWLLALAVAAYFVHVRFRPHLRAPWRRVTYSASGMSALVILAVFIVMGLLDSLHYRRALERQPGQEAAYSTEVISLFDAIATPLRERREKTYSAPFATRAFARETLEVPGPDGTLRQVRDYPRLSFSGAHLEDEADRGRDIHLRALKGLGAAALVWGLLAAALRRFSSRRSEVPWRAILITAGVVLALA